MTVITVMRGLDPRISLLPLSLVGEGQGEGFPNTQMHRAFRRLITCGMKEGWSVPSRGANFNFNRGTRALHPGDF
jgi:hypothetical protein